MKMNRISPTFFSVILLASAPFAQAGTLFVTDYYTNSIMEIAPDGTQSTFASGLQEPEGLAFDSSGNLYEADAVSGNIYKFTPTGVQSTFASGLVTPIGLAFDSSGNLYSAVQSQRHADHVFVGT